MDHRLGKRLFDMVCAALGLAILAPVLILAAIGVRLSSPGPVLYRAERLGRGGRPFTMHKFRTMTVDQGRRPSAVSAASDARVFPWGALLRKLKIDELPQLFDVLRGEMSVVGPRPEDPRLVRELYTEEDLKTLEVLPGLACIGTLYYYTHLEKMLVDGASEDLYARILPVKLALDGVYLRKQSLAYDLEIILRTIKVIVAKASGQRDFPDPPELAEIDPALLRFHGGSQK